MGNDDNSEKTLSDREIAERMARALRRMMTTPPKPYTPKPKTRSPSKGRVRKGKSRT